MDNSSLLPCLPEDCDNYSTADPFPPVIDYIQAAITLVIIVGSMTVNLFIVYLVVRFKRLRQRAFLLALLMISMNLCHAIVVLPVVFVSAILRRWVFGDVACLIFGGINDLYFAFHLITILVLTLDRFFTVFMPFFYDRHGNKIAIGMAFLPWVVGVLAIFSVNTCFRYAPTHKVCIASGSAGTSCAIAISTLVWSFVFAGVILPMVLYVIMYLKGRQLDKKLVTSKEMEDKRFFNKRVFRTFLLLLIVLVGITIMGMILFTWFLVNPAITLTFYTVQVLGGRTLSNAITITYPIIILSNREFREAWKNCSKHTWKEKLNCISK